MKVEKGLHRDGNATTRRRIADGQGAVARRLLASRVNTLMRRAEMSQRAAAKRLGLPQPKISAIKNYQLHGISLERLISALVALDQSVVISVGPRSSKTDGVRVIAHEEAQFRR